MRNRASALNGHVCAIDGTVKTDESTVNSLSHYSRKARVKGSKDISVLYAYDIDTLEPVCAKAYAGNVIDAVSYEDFLTENNITNGVIMGDKAFQRVAAEKAFAGHPDLHFLNPLKRSDKRIATNAMYDYEGMLSEANQDVLYKKVKLPHSYLYSFYDRNKAIAEEKEYFKLHKEDAKFDEKGMKESKNRFGTIVFESDMDVSPEVIFKMYSNRWMIETCFRYYKTVLELSDTKVHDDFSVYGSEFVNFLATVISMRLVKKFDETHLTDQMTYSEIMAQLRTAKKVKLPDGSMRYARTTKGTMETLAVLEIEPREGGSEGEVVKRKRGRPKRASTV